MVTHELRNPLNAMAGWLHLLGADPTVRSETARRAVEGARRAVAQQLTQIDTVGQLLRLSDGCVIPETDPIELGELLAVVVRRHAEAAAAGGHDIRLRFSLPPAAEGRPGLWVAVDSALFEPALDALVTFGLQHGSPGAVLELTVSSDGAVASLTLCIDEGPDAGVSIWRAFGDTGGRLSLDLYLAVLATECYGGCVRPLAAPGGGELLEIRFPVAASASSVANA